MSVKAIPLTEIAEINPSLGVSLADTDDVSFVPMGAFSEVTASVMAEETRQYVQVKKGFTAFRSGDVIFAKITPCFENGKIGLANISRNVGFGSTEFHVIRAKPGKADARFIHHFLRQGSVRLSGTKRMA
jgi:type I restriction enzyme S subunit